MADLGSKPANFLIFLSNRANNPPHTFANADFVAMECGYFAGVLKLEGLSGHVMTLTGVTEQAEYGKVIDLSSQPETTRDHLKAIHHSVSAGLLVLEAQEFSAQFRVDCCRSILHDILARQPLNDDPTMPLSISTLSLTPLAENFSVTDAKIQSQYAFPGSLDLEEIASLLAARKASAVNSLRSLLENPECLEEYFKTRTNHHVLCTTEDREEVPDSPKSNWLWRKSAKLLIDRNLMGVEYYSHLHERAVLLQALQAKHSSAFSWTEGPPEEYLRALLVFDEHLVRIAGLMHIWLQDMVLSAPAFRERVVRLNNLRADKSKKPHDVVVKPGVKLDNSQPEDQILSLLVDICDTCPRDWPTYIGNSVDRLQRMLQSNSKARKKIPPPLVQLLDDMAKLYYCKFKIAQYQPLLRTTHKYFFEKLEVRPGEDFRAIICALNSIEHAIDDDFLKRLSSALERPTGEQFWYPDKISNERRTKRIVQALRMEEGMINKFWASVNKGLSLQPGFRATAVYSILNSDRPSNRTPVYEPPKVEPSETDLDIELGVFIDGLSWWKDTATDVPAKKATLIEKPSKVKSRGVPNPLVQPVEETQPPTEDRPPPIVAVKARSLRLFRAMFQHPEATPTRRSIC